MKNDAVLKLNQKPHTKYGIVSLGLAIISLIIVIITIALSISQGNLTQSKIILIGTLEWCSAMLTIAGFCVAVIGEGAIEMERIIVHISLGLHIIGLIYHGIVVWNGFII